MKLRGTCIVAIADRGSVWLGADTMASDDSRKFTMGQKKLVRLSDDLLVGIAGSIRVKDILACSVSVPPRAESEANDYRYLVTALVPEVREKLRAGGALVVDSGVEELPDSALLIGYRGGVYVIDGDLQVSQLDSGYWAIGSGAEYALGALHASRSQKDIRKRITIALEAAAAFCPSVGPPFVVERLDGRA